MELNIVLKTHDKFKIVLKTHDKFKIKLKTPPKIIINLKTPILNTECKINSKKLCTNENCQVCYNRSFASHEKANFWNLEKNKILPRFEHKSGKKKMWFNCNCGHTFEKSLNNMRTGQWCPYCCISVQKLCNEDDCQLCFSNSFASHEKAKYWNIINDYTPRQVIKGTTKKYWFNCDKCNHTFEKILSTVSSEKQPTWCPYCSKCKPILCKDDNCQQCFNRSFASHEKVKCFDTKKNKNINPRHLLKHSENKYWFACDNCNHTFNIALSGVSWGRWCSYCCIPTQQLCISDDCQHCFDRSFASHEKSIYFSIGKNKIVPRQVTKCSNKNYWFICDCGHSFESLLSNINKGQWCPYCSNPPKKLCIDENCQVCYDNSFVSHEKANFWNLEKNKILPRLVFKSSSEKFWFNCNCGHSFESILSNTSKGVWCPYCCRNTRKICFSDDCKQCFSNSFASHEKSKYWDTDCNDKSPRQVIKGTHDKYWFNCGNCNFQFKSSLAHVSNGKWCPNCCKGKREREIGQYISIKYPHFTLTYNHRPNFLLNTKTGKNLELDLYCEKHAFAIEVQGIQHYEFTPRFHKTEDQFLYQIKKDKFKLETCISLGIKLLYIKYDDDECTLTIDNFLEQF